jgi:hypothetical protein
MDAAGMLDGGVPLLLQVGMGRELWGCSAGAVAKWGDLRMRATQIRLTLGAKV